MNYKALLARYYYLLILLASVIIALLLIYKPKIDAHKTHSEKVWSVESNTLKRGDYHPSIILFGQIESPQKSTLRSSISARVTNVTTREGKQVNKGDVLIQLDTSDFRLIFSERQAEIKSLLAQRQSEINRYQHDVDSMNHNKKLVDLNTKIMERFNYLNKRKLGSAAQVDEAYKTLVQQLMSQKERELSIKDHKSRLANLLAKIEQVKAQLERARLDLNDTKIQAPFDGKITKLSVSIGDLVAQNTKLLSLYNIHDIEIRAQLPHRVLPNILAAQKEKQVVIANIENSNSQPLKLLRLGAEIGQGDSNIDAFFTMPKEYAGQLPLGTTLQLLLQLPKEKDVYIIPATALYGHDTIYIINNNRLKAIKVQRIADSYSKKTHDFLIRSGQLKSGDKLLTNKLPNARTGLKVVTK
jgi:RND family efflux transporter MFP subunit